MKVRRGGHDHGITALIIGGRIAHDPKQETERDAMLSEGTPAPGAMLKSLKGSGVRRCPVVGGIVPKLFQPTAGSASYAGLAPTPWRSGSVAHEQGVSKAGNPRLRTTMIQLAWLWVRHQPRSILTLWFHQRVQLNGGRVRKVLIVALARKLLIALPFQSSGA